MSEMSFSEYSAEISALLENEDFAAAISMARNLLRQYPKCVDGYRFLAQAVVGTGEYREAADLFRRALSADPEDLVARVGLAAVYREEGILDEAIWQMLRAFEMAPGNGEVRQQLRALFEQRDGRAPGRLKLNSAALARVYMRDGWYERAADELRVQLESEPDRVDLRVALAEALWRAGRRQEAVETSEEILVELPFCLKANLFLGQFYAETGDSDAAWDRLQIAQALDPENRVAAELFGEASHLPPQNVTVRLPDEEADAETFPTGDDEDLPQWLRSLSMEEGTESAQWPEFGADDWRDRLRALTEEALDQWQPDWRVELRRATAQAFPGEQAPVAAAPSLAPEWQAALRAATEEALRGWESAEPIAPAAPSVAEAVESEPVEPAEVRGTPAEPRPEPAISSGPPDWREALAGETIAALEEAERPAVETADWHASLAAATGAELEREIAIEEAHSPLDAGEAFPGPRVDFETIVESEEPAPPAEPGPAVPEIADWRVSLAAETRALLEATEQPAGEAEPTGWRETLHDATRAVIDTAEHLVEAVKSTDWRDVLADVTRKTLDRVPLSSQEAEVAEAPAPDESLETATAPPQQIEPGLVTIETDQEAPAFEAGKAVADQDAPFQAEPAVADQGRTGMEREELSAVEAVAGELAAAEIEDHDIPHTESGAFEEALAPAESFGQEPAPELAEIVPAELAEPLAEPELAERPTEPEVAVDEAQPPPAVPSTAPVQLEPPAPDWPGFPAAVHIPTPEPTAVERPEAGEPARAPAAEVEAVEAPEPAGLPSSADRLKPAERESPSLEDRLLLADRLRSAGAAEAALTHYQAIADATDLLDESLIERLLAWTKEDDASARVHQLLGDVYRRRNQLREAVDQYRAAISKM